ncbi:MAG: cell division protein FtsX [Bacteroidales bacterium]|nr:cell division protein FtsX [Bacteroidales bacterium]
MSKSEIKLEKRRLRSSYFTSTVSITLLLILLGSVGLLLLNTKRLSDYVRENIIFKVILADNVREVDIFQIQKSLDAKPYVKETDYITKEAAAVELKEELGENFIEFIGHNPLLPSIEVKFLASYANADSIAIIESDLKEFSQIKEVYYQKNLIHTVNQNVRKISLLVLFFSGFLLLIAIALINNTIRLAVYAKRFIIRTMQLVGATAGYIRRPFLYRSLIQGIISALFAIGTLTAFIYFLQNEMEGIIRLNDVKTLGLLFGLVLLMGVFINWISTYTAVTKYLFIKTDKLYT